MTEQRGGMGRVASALMVLAFLAVTGVAVACLRWLGDYENHEFALNLTERILWGVWVVAAVATFLTHVTIFGWSFRSYVRWDKSVSPAAPPPRRPTTAPWYKSPVTSFTVTVVLVSLLGLATLTTVVLWIVEDKIGRWMFWLVSMIIWSTWWVLVLTAVLTRIAIFGLHKGKVKAAANQGPAPTNITTSKEQA